MTKDKGCFEAIELANKYKNIHFNFAGNWENKEDEKEFLQIIKKYNLKNVAFHGFLVEKKK